MKSLDEPVEYPLGGALEFLKGLWALNHAMERLSLRMLDELGVTAQQRLVIRCVGKYPGITSGGLAATLHLNAGTMSVALDRLENKGLVERRRDPRDRRRVLLGLTASGRRFDRKTPGTVEHAVNRLLEDESAADIEAAKRVIDKLSSLLSEEAGGHPGGAVGARGNVPPG